MRTFGRVFFGALTVTPLVIFAFAVTYGLLYCAAGEQTVSQIQIDVAR